MKTAKCFVVVGLCLLIVSCPWQKGELDIDIGDYESHWEAWNGQNLLDYKISMKLNYKTHTYTNTNTIFASNVKNGIPDRDTYNSSFYRLEKATIPAIYSFIKKEEVRIRNVYNGINRPYLHVQYNTACAYITSIQSSRTFLNSGSLRGISVNTFNKQARR